MGASVEFQRLLREAALRVTRPRVAVLGAVYANPHADLETIVRATRAQVPDVSHQTVYDALSALSPRSRLVRRIQPAGSVARYESRVGDNHHVVCRSCGAVADVGRAVGDACLVPAGGGRRLEGFTVDEAEVIYWGYCPDCSTVSPARSES